MAYHLLNIETSDYYYCEDSEWISAIETAKENGWLPDGTVFDAVYEAEDQSYDSTDILQFLYVFIHSSREREEWNGSYFEKKNQLVTYEDAIYLAADLEGTDVDTKLVEFIKKGSFRICSL